MLSKMGWGRVLLSMRRGGLTDITPVGSKMAEGRSPRTRPSSSLKPFNASPILIE